MLAIRNSEYNITVACVQFQLDIHVVRCAFFFNLKTSIFSDVTNFRQLPIFVLDT
jgi:hypothetical protein